MSRDNAVLLVIDEARSGHGLTLARDLGIAAVRTNDLAADMLAPDPNLVFDVDLRSVDVVLRLKSLLKPHGKGCRIFLTDPAVRVTGVHAKVLGADVTLPLTSTAWDIKAAMRKHFAEPKSETVQSVRDGVNALDLTFRALGERTVLDTDNVLNAGTRIADAILDDGTEAWLETVKGYHMGTFQHCMLVTGVAAGFGARTGMARRDIATLTVAGLLHDIGKAKVPVEILDKPGPLTPEEMKVMQLHPVTGATYLDEFSTVDAAIRKTVRHHHEMLDGSGYPDGLSGKEIDDLTRILTICDIYAALVERRSYKPAKTPEQAIFILEVLGSQNKVEADLVRALARIMVPGR
ncbi:MAG: HD domain-containing phosphohydrolase [Devosia sp.]